MISKVAAFSLIVTISVFLSSCKNENIQGLINAETLIWNIVTSDTGTAFKAASPVKSAADKLYSQSLSIFKQLTASSETYMQSCDFDDTAVITIYSTNGTAQNEIDVKLDGSHVGSLITFFPNEEPHCKTPSADGIITLMVPSGNHTLEATSPNLTWPSHTFSVEKCGCVALPLS